MAGPVTGGDGTDGWGLGVTGRGGPRTRAPRRRAQTCAPGRACLGSGGCPALSPELQDGVHRDGCAQIRVALTERRGGTWESAGVSQSSSPHFNVLLPQVNFRLPKLWLPELAAAHMHVHV